MNVIKKYWDSVYIYVLLLVPGLCMCAGSYWTGCKMIGLYPDLQWVQIIIFDFSQFIYLAISLYFIYKNKKDSTYIAKHLIYVKTYIVLILFIQYNFILYLFSSVHVWECTFIFFAIIAVLFDSKLMLLNIFSYLIFLLVAHFLRPQDFIPFTDENFKEVIAYRILIFTVTSFCIQIIVYFTERFLIQAKESDEENIYLIEKQLEYYKDIELLDTELRKFRHDIKNHFICMESLFQNGKIDELEKYFQDLHQSFSFEQKIYVSGNDVIDAILHHELPHYCRDEVKVTIYGSLSDIRTVSAMDLCTLFSNLLSNAVASANNCVDFLEAQITIHFSSGNKYFSIKISNSILPQHGIRKKKDRNHGYGIYKIKNVLEKYDGRFEQNVDQNIMTITVYLPI